MEINIQKFTDRDFDRVLVLWRISRELSSNGAENARKHSLYEDIQYLRNEILAHNKLWLAETKEEGLVAFMAMNTDFIDSLYVHPDHFHKGIGQQMLAWALKCSPNRIWLNTLRDNTRARAFYEKFGFRLIAEGENPEGWPDVTYEFIPREVGSKNE